MEDDTKEWTGWFRCNICDERFFGMVEIDVGLHEPILPMKCLNGHTAGYPEPGQSGNVDGPPA